MSLKVIPKVTLIQFKQNSSNYIVLGSVNLCFTC